MLLSIIIPIYRSENTIQKLVESFLQNLSEIDFEIILINDGSPDNSENICFELAKQYQKVSCISLRKNFGEFNAVICGLHHVSGQYAVMVDDDFQQAPSEVLKLLKKIQSEDLDVVYGRYETKKHAPYRNFGTWFVNKLTTKLFDKPADLYLSSFKIIKKEVIDEMIKYKGVYPYLDGLIFQITNHVGQVIVEHQARKEGVSNYTFSKLSTLLLSVIFGYSLAPIRLFYSLGLILIFLAIGGTVLHLLDFTDALLASLIMMLSAVQLLSIAFLGEYIGKSYLIQTNKPQFIIKKSILKNHAKHS
jgi:glycosyltransferase involved in cell wall biosynthesis